MLLNSTAVLPFGGLARDLLRLALIAFTYWLAARLSLSLAVVHGQVTPVWPPSGIALVAFLVIGRRAWPAIALGAFAVNLPIGPSLFGSAVIAAGNTLAPFVAAELLRRGGVPPPPRRAGGAGRPLFRAAGGAAGQGNPRKPAALRSP